MTLNDRSDWADHAALYEYGFAAFARKRAVARGEEYTLAPVRGGTQTSVSLAAGESFFYPVTAGEELLVSARLPEELTAPLTAGQAVGELIVSMDGRGARAGAARMRGAGRGGRKKAEPVRAAV